MNFEYYISLIKDPDKVRAEDSSQLLELCEKYPYFSLIRWLYIKSLKVADSLEYKQELKLASIYAPDRKKLYFFIHPEESFTEKRERLSIGTGSYFDIIDNYNIEVNESDKSNSLTSLAQRLKEARDLLKNEEKEGNKEDLEKTQEPIILNSNQSEKINNSDSDNKKYTEQPKTSNLLNVEELAEEKNIEKENLIIEKEKKVKILIKEKQYADAITLLDELILINPKKSVYFADQIHFLQKILDYNQ